ncbi:NUDIX hydrolase [Fervidicella metallireducens AeB]|uniref:NUDIX hydrolase n=1 Tax=Fervidicella metallireducens AeB TaxID=1403537 RepID=A0A017RZK8_9CLOT|nr:CoA pyrophosphatase [Fervidicella metallireducens]EYE89375.1 NUDIX hydrolase [Fervidicella metallireducens AeB]
MKIDFISKVFRNKDIGIMGENNEYRRYAVVIPIINIDGELNVIFEVRSKNMRSQPGEISFPGGKVEEFESPEKASIRETCEELNIEEKQINIIGQMDTLITQHGKIIYPFIAEIDNKVTIKPSQTEVDHIFYVPLKFFMEIKPIVKRIKVISLPEEEFPYTDMEGAMGYNWDVGRHNVYFYRFKDYVIWGLTAKIIYYFIEELKINENFF